MKGETSIKVSEKGKLFLKQIQINRIKLDLPELTQVKALDLVSDYFKNNNDSYIKMVKGGTQNV